MFSYVARCCLARVSPFEDDHLPRPSRGTEDGRRAKPSPSNSGRREMDLHCALPRETQLRSHRIESSGVCKLDIEFRKEQRPAASAEDRVEKQAVEVSDQRTNSAPRKVSKTDRSAPLTLEKNVSFLPKSGDLVPRSEHMTSWIRGRRS